VITFRYPKVGEVENKKQVCLGVQVSCLLDLLRFAQAKEIKVHQIYDFFTY